MEGVAPLDWKLDNAIHLTVDEKPAVVWFTDHEFKVSALGLHGDAPDTVKLCTSLKHVLHGELRADGSAHIATLALKQKQHVVLWITGKPQDGEKELVQAWMGRLMTAAGCIVPGRRIKVIVNPFGGQGKGKHIFEHRARPVFEAAKCFLDVTFTTHSGHAEEVAASLDVSAYDAIAIVSGDGVAYEVFNGLAKHKDALRALRLPVAHVPAGSGNAFTVSLIGPKDCRDVALAVLNAVKGRVVPLDIASITQGNERRVTFLSQTMGLMADLDLGTENLRWMGDQRFIVGFVQGVLRMKHCPVKVWLKVAESDKQKIADVFRAHYTFNTDKSHADGTANGTANGNASALEEEPAEGEGMPPLKWRDSDNDGWVEFPEKIIYLYGGMMPYVARDFMQFPAAEMNDGCLDLVLQTPAPRTTMLSSQDGAHSGKQFWMPSQHYFKVHAYRAIPLAQKGNISIDGERWPFLPFQVEVHKGLGRTLSMLGRWAGEGGCLTQEEK
ncbi:hypothetical protein DACRYDRAFT_98209 [Dacryopinax primogenitus]|uniref:DAGKc domain-containing protein n=1 Tax=Dacryopinax primogenitus (strain DJM 731) TaxID=1858805 RepID=M5GAU4_DACPD|nr:uncharacterized protein DACRYDRAFT_98209 [Dacryopinax primogenitus]EJU05500.1 hypothetical protein DACRYDRAFT_98209 [Dacryopinax primogenitus]